MVTCLLAADARLPRAQFELKFLQGTGCREQFALKNTDLKNCKYMDYMQESRMTAACHVNAIATQQIALQHVVRQSCWLSRPVQMYLKPPKSASKYIITSRI